MILFRFDGNAQIGLGHAMRCLAIADEARAMGEPCAILTADHQLDELIRDHGYRHICLEGDWGRLEDELDALEEVIRKEAPQAVLIDSYQVTESYLGRLNEMTRVIYMDDVNAFTYPCSGLINYNIYAEDLDYRDRYPQEKLFLGIRYAPMRPEFRDIEPKDTDKDVTDVLITAGGSDVFNTAGSMTAAFKEDNRLKDLHYHIVAGAQNPHMEDLHALAARYPGVTIHTGVRKMSELMGQCDLAVSAGGVTLYELAACGVPTVCFAWADNQIGNVETFAFKKKLMLSPGDVQGMTDHERNGRLAQELCKLVSDKKLRGQMSSALQGQVDGRGAVRIAEILRGRD